jgi:hypothetical protein
MNSPQQILSSPEFYPLKIDFQKRVMQFVRMSRDSYQKSVFLDNRTKHLGVDTYEVRIDDLLFGFAGLPRANRTVHYIFHTTFCCSTLLARYFELLESCHVLKEPGLLTQLALVPNRSTSAWKDAFEIGIRLLTRTFEPNEYVFIKPHEPVNSLGEIILGQDNLSTITFLSTPLRPFLLAVLKDQERRNWIRRRVIGAAPTVSASSALASIDPGNLNDAQSASYLWLVNKYLSQRLASGSNGSRVILIDGGLVADSPGEAIRRVATTCGLPLEEQTLRWMVSHPSMQRYSKDISRPYNADSRRDELQELETRLGTEADAAIYWAESEGLI